MLVSIITPCFNAAPFIKDAIQSILNQSYNNIELIIVNDGSLDDSEKIIKQFKDERLKYYFQENKGQDAALNYGYKQASGHYIKFMDADDLINPEMIELQMKILNGSGDHVAYGEWARFYHNKPEFADFTYLDYWHDSDPISFLTARPEGVMLQCGGILIPRELIEQAGGWDERLILFNDTEFFTRVFLASKGIKFSPGARLFYRSGQTSSISAQRSRKFFESTFLATSLISKQLLSCEDSYRVRNLVSNMFQYRYYDMYPHFQDLGKKHEEMIRHYGNVTMKPDGGKIFKFLLKYMSWKKAKLIQTFFYKLGYLKLIKK